jgi:hypothetical protein
MPVRGERTPCPVRAKEKQMVADLSKISSTELREAIETLCRASGAELYGSTDDVYEIERHKNLRLDALHNTEDIYGTEKLISLDPDIFDEMVRRFESADNGKTPTADIWTAVVTDVVEEQKREIKEETAGAPEMSDDSLDRLKKICRIASDNCSRKFKTGKNELGYFLNVDGRAYITCMEDPDVIKDAVVNIFYGTTGKIMTRCYTDEFPF